ncbi:MAG: BrnA antitoxin family protein [Elainellaceae cyanobacterium]
MAMEAEYNFNQGKRGAIAPAAPGKTRITICLDDDVLAWFREQVHAAGGGNDQTLINDALRQHIQQQREPIEETLRRVVREELRGAQYPHPSRPRRM